MAALITIPALVPVLMRLRVPVVVIVLLIVIAVAVFAWLVRLKLLPVDTPMPVIAWVSIKVTLPVVLAVTFGVAIVSEPIAPLPLVSDTDVGPVIVAGPVILPEPLADMVTVVELLVAALTPILPFEPDDVCRTIAFPEMVLEIVIAPLLVNVNVPLVEVRVPNNMPMLARKPVVVTEKLPPTEDKASVVVPVFEMSAVPGLPVLAESVAAAVNMGVPEEPILPVPEVKVIVPLVRVTAPDLLMLPEPLAFRLIVPIAPVEVFALMAMPELLPLVDSATVAVLETASADPTVSVPPELTMIALVVPEIAPSVVVLDAPSVLIVRVLAPSVIV